MTLSSTSPVTGCEPKSQMIEVKYDEIGVYRDLAYSLLLQQVFVYLSLRLE